MTLKQRSSSAASLRADPAQLTFSPLRFKHTRDLLTIRETAEAIGIAANHIRDLLDEGELRAAPINHNARRDHVRILRSTVEAWFLENYLLHNGAEYPLANSPDVSYWRHELRQKRAALKDLKQEARS